MTLISEPSAFITGDREPAAPDRNESVAVDRFDLTSFDGLPVREVPIGALSPGLYLRQRGTNPAHVQLLAEAATGPELPPILVQEDGWRVIDGLHRLAAARLRGDSAIRVRFLDCADSEALVLAIKANSAHGLPLSKADRVAGAQRVLTDHPDWSDRAIAGMTALSAKTIASLRSRVITEETPGVKRLGRDGRRRPVVTSEGRRRAAEYLQAHPDAPLRQVARETDVSLGTVHDVSARIRRGDSPERNGRRAQPNSVPGSMVGSMLGAMPNPMLTSLPGSTPRTIPNPVPLHLDGSVAAAVGVPAGGHGAAVRRIGHSEPAPTWADVVGKIANDPTVRYTDGGKDFLRWMAMHASTPDAWRAFVQSIPAHWLSVIAPIADGMAKEWSQFAERLQNPHVHHQQIAR